MAFASIHNQNPFVLPGLFLLLLLAGRQYFISRPGRVRPYAQKLGRRSLMVLGFLLGVCIVFAPLFELYYRSYQCEVSQQYMYENLVLARKAMVAMAAHGIPFWLDYASLLNHLRGQQLNRWEQDVDISTIHPLYLESVRNLPLLMDGSLVGPALDRATADPEAPGLALSREHLMEKMAAEGFRPTHSVVDGRELIQLWGPSPRGPHVDIWMWAPGAPGQVPTARNMPLPPPPSAGDPSTKQWSVDNPPVFYTGDIVAFNPRPYSALFPLDKAQWLGVEVGVPRDPHEVSEKEFGHYGGSYMVAQVFRGDCFHNFFQLRMAY